MFLWPQPNEEVHLNILADVCERFIFVHKDERVRRYLGRLAPQAEGSSTEPALDMA